MPIVHRITEQVLEPPLAVAEIGKRQSHMALALVGRIVHSHHQPLVTGALPGKN
jgi:hypothetical protein